MEMSGRETTARAPRDMGCSGSAIVAMRSAGVHVVSFWYTGFF